MNPIMRILWRWQGTAKLIHSDNSIRYTAIRKLGETGHPNDSLKLVNLLSDDSQTIRNAASISLKEIIIQNFENDEFLQLFESSIQKQFEKSSSLVEKLSLIEVMRQLALPVRELLLGPLVLESEHDLQYAIVKSLSDTKNTHILDDILTASDTPDLILRRISLQTWHAGIVDQKLEEILNYCSPRLHYLVRATYELQTSGELLRKILSYSDSSTLPSPKAYPDFIIRYMTELLSNWEYDPDAFKSLHAIMVPSYFTFDPTSNVERPFVVL